jgi:hypothetical protein
MVKSYQKPLVAVASRTTETLYTRSHYQSHLPLHQPTPLCAPHAS